MPGSKLSFGSSKVSEMLKFLENLQFSRRDMYTSTTECSYKRMWEMKMHVLEYMF